MTIAPAMVVRVWVPDVWDVVDLDVTPDHTFARIKADALERDAQDKHRSIIGVLETQRNALEAQLDQLRQFEREYRSRLKSYLEGQLRELDSQQLEDVGIDPSARRAEIAKWFWQP